MSHCSDDVTAAEDVETVLKEFVARDMVPDKVTADVDRLRAAGRSGKALHLILDARRDE